MHPVLRQVAFFVVGLWLAATFAFFLPQITGNVPFSGSLRAEYLGYLHHLLLGDLGGSTDPRDPGASVNRLIASALPWTLTLIGVATMIGLIMGTALGMVAAWFRGRTTDTVLTPTLMFLSSLPYYFVALEVIYVGGVVLHWLPVSGAYAYDVNLQRTMTFVLDAGRHAILPVLSLLIASLGIWMLPMRTAMVQTLEEDYMALARAKGLPQRRIILAYAARNALLPPLASAAIQIGYVVSGAMLVEVAFSYPGVGLLLVHAVAVRDYPLVRGLLLCSALSVLLANLIANLLSVVIDPRLRAP